MLCGTGIYLRAVFSITKDKCFWTVQSSEYEHIFNQFTVMQLSRVCMILKEKCLDPCMQLLEF